MKHRAVFAIDEQGKTVDYFPFDKAEVPAKERARQGVSDAEVRMGGRGRDAERDAKAADCFANTARVECAAGH